MAAQRPPQRAKQRRSPAVELKSEDANPGPGERAAHRGLVTEDGCKASPRPFDFARDVAPHFPPTGIHRGEGKRGSGRGWLAQSPSLGIISEAIIHGSTDVCTGAAADTGRWAARNSPSHNLHEME